MKHTRASRTVRTLAALAVIGCADEAPAPALSRAEVEAFMRSYQTVLQGRDGPGVVSHYDTSGVFVLGNGDKELVPFDTLAVRYSAGWTGPDYFTFQNLSYVPAGDSAMVVAGQFLWFQAGMPDTMRFSYTSLVHRTPIGLRIKVEDESYASPSP